MTETSTTSSSDKQWQRQKKKQGQHPLTPFAAVSRKGATSSRFASTLRSAIPLCIIAFVTTRQLTFHYLPAAQLVQFSTTVRAQSQRDLSAIEQPSATATYNNDIATTSSSSVTNTSSINSKNQSWKPTEDTPYEICFVTSVYGDNAAISDQPLDVTQLQKTNPTSRFFAFTNMPDLKADGWNLMANNSTRYRRYITRSRWPKFMGWKHPEVIKCQAVFYMDGFCGPKPGTMQRLKVIARDIAESKYGIAQNEHELGGGAFDELDRIIKARKDIVKNTKATKAWLQAQPDFNLNATVYVNRYIGYDPKNQYWQKAAQFFWDRYSQELDSWRDQPLWSYTVDKFKIEPTHLVEFDTTFHMYKERMAKNMHKYDATSDRKGQ